METDWRGLGTCPKGDVLAVRKREDRAGERIFERDKYGRGCMDVGAGDGVLLNVGERKVVAIYWRNGDGEGAAEGGDTAGFPVRMRGVSCGRLRDGLGGGF